MRRTAWSLTREIHQWVGPRGVSSINPLMRRTLWSLIEKSTNEKDYKEFDREIHQWVGPRGGVSTYECMGPRGVSTYEKDRLEFDWEIHQWEGLEWIWPRNPPMRRSVSAYPPGSRFRLVLFSNCMADFSEFPLLLPNKPWKEAIKGTISKGFISRSRYQTRRSADGPQCWTHSRLYSDPNIHLYNSTAQRYSGICLLHNGKRHKDNIAHTQKELQL